MQTTGTARARGPATRFGLDRTSSGGSCTITGMAAGFTVLFGAPLGGAVFALEILHRRGPRVLRGAAAGGDRVAVRATASTSPLTGVGLEPVWRFPSPPAPARMATSAGPRRAASPARSSPSIFTCLTTRLAAGRLPPAPAVGAARGRRRCCSALLAFSSPYALTFGEAQLGELLAAPQPRWHAAARRVLGQAVRHHRHAGGRAGRAASSSRCSSWAAASASCCHAVAARRRRAGAGRRA